MSIFHDYVHLYYQRTSFTKGFGPKDLTKKYEKLQASHTQISPVKSTLGMLRLSLCFFLETSGKARHGQKVNF